ncbi:sporulation protein YabP [Desulfuribacillus stibiiarsenatis]|uniref:Sporulation protein YabP n=1 Tax=Desulfuribacillus stibiiarsenatis TaxID=1390249 RepID=A0A1E5L2K3_9FIRM|nr:sporulation protein YabP [Desulfuribacillus stibiiarsenatis]OEH84348.1 sporulation protein YabP [Desulfuribacillus stibiiarsenatis]
MDIYQKKVDKPFDRHEIKIVNRKLLEVTGVMNIESFDSQEFLLQTSQGYLAVRGENLHIRNLNLEEGLVSIEGNVFDMGYIDESITPSEKAKGFFSKLFK